MKETSGRTHVTDTKKDRGSLTKPEERLVPLRPTGRGLPFPYTEDEVETAIYENRGIMISVARYLGVSRTALYDFVRDKDRLQAAMRSARSAIVDDLEQTLFDKALGGDTIALIFALKTQGRDRGWNENQRIEIVDERAERERDARADALYLGEVLSEFRSLMAGDVIEGEAEEIPAIEAGSPAVVEDD